jgi:hypothetical protein
MRMRRGLSGVLVLGLLVGGVAACSDDGDGDGGDAAAESTTTAADGGDAQETTTTAAAGDQPTTTASEVVAANDAVIQEYCDAKDAYNALLDESLAEPDDTGIQDQLRDASGRLGEASDAVAPVVETFTPEQQAQFEECEAA